MHNLAKQFRGLHTTEEAYFRCNRCDAIVGSVGPDESYGTLPDDIDRLITDWFKHQVNVCQESS